MKFREFILGAIVIYFICMGAFLAIHLFFLCLDWMIENYQLWQIASSIAVLTSGFVTIFSTEKKDKITP